MLLTLDKTAYIMERGKQAFFVESGKKGKRRVINLGRVDYVEFANVPHYATDETIFTARLQYEGARCHVFEGADAGALYNYYIHSMEMMYDDRPNELEGILEENSEVAQWT